MTDTSPPDLHPPMPAGDNSLPVEPNRPPPVRGVRWDEYPGFTDLRQVHAEDSSLAVPFSFPLRSGDERIAVICHLFHAEMAAEFATLLQNIPGCFDTFISTDTEAKRTAVAAAFAGWSRGKFEIRLVPNIGRDIAPKLVAFADVYPGYDLVLCLHSKASNHHPDLAGWRQHLLHHLLGSPEIVGSILTIFRQCGDLGIVGPQHYEPARKWLGWSGNFELARNLAARLGVTLDIEHVLDFPSGSMFWARPQALQPLLALNLGTADFPVEVGQKDGTLAHAVERLFYFAAELAGMTWVKIADPSRHEEPLGVNSLGSLSELHQVLARRRRILVSSEPERVRETAGGQKLSLDSRKRLLRAELHSQLAEFLASGEHIKLETSANPKVSVLVVTWNQAELTFACLRSLASNVSAPFEVVLIDNASSDATSQLLERVEGVRIERNTQNVGFLLAVNRAAALASGENVLLLNNDAIVRSGAIEAAISVLDSDGTIGAVGGPIVLPDGTLQEAGSIVWQDGTCLGYGRGRNPSDAEFRFRRDVDYCSGAFLLVRRHLWRQLGGFDEAYAPAYYEETDFCLRLRASGHRVVYEPRAAIDHYEFGSAVQNVSALAQQLKNQQLFCRKNWDIVRHQHPATPHRAVIARSPARGHGRILVIDEMVPHETHGAGYPRCAKILGILDSEGFEVSFYPLLSPMDEWDDVYRTLPRTIEVLLDRGVSGLKAFLTERMNCFDFVLVSRPTNMTIVADLLAEDRSLLGKAKLVYDAEALFSQRDLLRRQLLGVEAMESGGADLRAEELALVGFADYILAVSRQEAGYLERAGKPVTIVGHLLELTPGSAAWTDRRDVLFVGRLDGEGSPNVDSLQWFATEVLPLIWQTDPGIRLIVAGKNEAPSVQAIASDRRIQLLGPVDDLDEIYNSARVFVAPTRFAAGIPHKVHAAASHGLPSVVTSLLAQQLEWTHGTEVLIGSDAEEFSQGVLALYGDAQLWGRVRDEALRAVAKDCGLDNFRAGLLQVFKHQSDPR